MQRRLSRVEPNPPSLAMASKTDKEKCPKPIRNFRFMPPVPHPNLAGTSWRGFHLHCELPMSKSLLKNPLGRALKKNLLLRASSEEQICSSYLFKAISNTLPPPYTHTTSSSPSLLVLIFFWLQACRNGLTGIRRFGYCSS